MVTSEVAGIRELWPVLGVEVFQQVEEHVFPDLITACL